MRFKIGIAALLALGAICIAVSLTYGQPANPAPGPPPNAPAAGNPPPAGPAGPPPAGPMMNAPGPAPDGPPAPPPPEMMKGGPMRGGPMGPPHRSPMPFPPPPPPGGPMGSLVIHLSCLALILAVVALVWTWRRSRVAALPTRQPEAAPASIAVVDGVVYVARDDRIMAFAAGTLNRLAEAPYEATAALAPSPPPPASE